MAAAKSVSHLKTPHVLLDTTVFDSANYAYTSGALKALADLASTNRVHVHLSDITVREAKAHISRAVANALPAHRHFEDKARILRNSADPAIQTRFGSLDIAAAQAELLAQFDTFLSSAKINVLGTSDADVESVLNAYFEGKPPFGEGKRKAEFPDAFTLDAAVRWTEDDGQQIYVVSADSGVRDACDGKALIPLEKLSAFLDLVAQEDEAQAKFIHETATARFSDVVERIKEDFRNQGFMVRDEDGEVNEVTVTDVRLKDVDILSVADDFANLELQVRIRYRAEISYADLDHAAYDSEEGRYMVWDTVEKTVKGVEDVAVAATVSFDADDPDSFEFDHVDIEGPDTYWVDADDEWPNK